MRPEQIKRSPRLGRTSCFGSVDVILQLDKSSMNGVAFGGKKSIEHAYNLFAKWLGQGERELKFDVLHHRHRASLCQARFRRHHT